MVDAFEGRNRDRTNDALAACARLETPIVADEKL
jgi:hypothetical protein